MQKEVWKDVPGYEGLYQVSDQGRVKSVGRIVYYSDGRVYNKNSRILSNSNAGGGYTKSTLYMNEKRVILKTHQLVAMAFLNHIPCGHKIVVDHIDNDKKNNKLNNLQLITARENISKDKKNKTSKYTGVHWSKQNKKWVAAIRIDGKQTYLGQSDCELESSKMYNKALKELNNEV